MAFRQIPCSVYDFPAMETWLGDMAKKGWFFDDFFAEGMATFIKGDPKNVTYRLEPADHKGEPTLEQRELFGAAGWEFVAKGWTDHIWVFRSFLEEPVPIHTDPATQAVALQRLQKQLRKKNYILIAVWLLLGGFYLWMILFGLSVRRWIIDGFQLFNALYWLVLVAYWLVLLTADLLPLRRLIRTLSAGVPMEHHGRYGWRKWSYRGLLVVAAVYLTFMVTVERQERPSERWELTDHPPFYVTLEQLGGEPTTEGGVTWVDGILAEQWTVVQGKKEETGLHQSGYYWVMHRYESEMRLYRTAFPLLGWMVERDILRNEPDLLLADQLEGTGLDGAWYLDEGGLQQSLLLREGSDVLWARVDGRLPCDLRDFAVEYAAILEG